MAEPNFGDLQQRVYDLIRLAGWDGKTTDEIEAETGLTHQSISARVNELANWKDEHGNKKPLIERRGAKRKTRTGRSAFIYVLAGLVEADRRRDDEPRPN